YVEHWYFTHAGRLDAVKISNKSQADDTFGISRVDNHLTMCSIASVRASHNVLSDHELSFPEFLRAKNFFLDHARKAEWPIAYLDTLAKFFWLLYTHPMIQLPLEERIILTYASRVHLDWHRELKASRRYYDISVTNQNLLHAIANEVWVLDDELVKVKVSLSFPSNQQAPSSLLPSCIAVCTSNRYIALVLYLCATIQSPPLRLPYYGAVDNILPLTPAHRY
ncbi:hypothetical protein L210DRAFT_3400893, partial [Boletus edulis BED1]